MSCFLNTLVARSVMFLAKVQLRPKILIALGVEVLDFGGESKQIL